MVKSQLPRPRPSRVAAAVLILGASVAGAQALTVERTGLHPELRANCARASVTPRPPSPRWSALDDAPRDRDHAWAAPMEQSLTRHLAAELPDFLPGARLDGVTCFTATCTVDLHVAPLDRDFAPAFVGLVLGPYAARSRVGRDGDPTHLRVHVSYQRHADGPRVEPTAFEADLAAMHPRYLSWRERIRAAPARARADFFIGPSIVCR